MSLFLFLKILAIYGSLLSLVWLVAPQAGLGNAPDAKSLFVARALGSAGLTIALMNWLISFQPPEVIRTFLWPNVFMETMPIIFSLINLSNRTFGPREWAGPITHGLPLIGLVLFLIVGR